MNILVIGCDQVGASLIRDLERIGHDISLIEKDPEQLKRLDAFDDYSFAGTALVGDPTDPDTLRQGGIDSCDVVAAYLYGLGVKDMLVDIGEIFCDGVNPGGKPWRVGVDRPFDGNNDPGTDLDGIWESQNAPCGIVTSGNYRKFYVHDGKKYAHTIDPRTGYPVQHNLLSATIVAKDATDADAYATYCMVIGLEKAKEFIERSPDDLAGYLIYADENGEMHEWASANFNLKCN